MDYNTIVSINEERIQLFILEDDYYDFEYEQYLEYMDWIEQTYYD
jgi:hypothetical protein